MAQRPSYSKTGDLEFNLGSVKLLLGFARRSIKRHRKLALAVFSGVMVLTLMALYFMPPLYRVQSRILTHTNYIIPALATPGRSIPWQAQSAVDGAVEVIRSRENLRGIIEDADLAGTWDTTRTPIGRVLDKIRTTIFGELSYEDKQQALISILDDRFSAFIEDEKIVVMTLDWHDPGMAVRILDTAQKRFLDGRKHRELSEINETVKILERQVTEGQPMLDRAADRIREVAMRTPGVRVVQRENPERPRPAPAGRSGIDSAAQRELEEDLRVKRNAIAELERDYRTRLQGAQDHLNKLRGTLGPNHPDVINANRNLDLQSRPPEELAGLRTEEARMAMQLNRMLIAAGATPQAAAAAASRPIVTMSNDKQPNPELDQAMSEYERVERSQSEIFRRLEDARIEVQTATAGFTYRYLITQPPVFPRKPVKPKKPMIVMSGFIAAIFLGMALAIAADIVSGRIVEPWQVPRFVGVPLLGEIREPPQRLRS